MATTVSMPQLGETVTEGTILSWAKQVGDTIAEDEVLLEISTDKVDTEVPSPAAGVILEILVPEGETVEVGAALCVIGESGEGSGDAAPDAETVAEPEAAPAPQESAAPPAAEAPAPAPAPAPAAAPAAAGVASAAPSGGSATAVMEGERRAVLSPVVRKLAAEHDVDLAQVPGTGEGGRITRKDLMAFVESGSAQATPTPAPAAPAAAPTPAPAPAVATEQAPPVPSAPAATPASAPAATSAPAAASTSTGPGDRTVEIGRLRKRIAQNMVQSKATAAHVWTSVEVDFERVEQVRRKHKEAFKAQEGFSLTYLPFIARATIDALHAFPAVNSSFLLDQGQQIFHGQVHLGIAIDLNQEGLVVTTVRGADSLTIKGIARDIRAKADRARNGQLSPDDISGSSFTITNPGPFGSFMSAPIINVPNTGILSTDTVTKRPTVVTNDDGSDAIAIRHIGYLGLTWDHRAFDGSTAVLFLRRIKDNLETWDWEQELR